MAPFGVGINDVFLAAIGSNVWGGYLQEGSDRGFNLRNHHLFFVKNGKYTKARR